MRRPGRILVISLAAFGLAVVLFRAAISGFLGPEDSTGAMTAGVVGLLLGLAAPYFVVVSALSARGAARLRDGRDVIASWQVPPDGWERFRQIELEDTGVRLPFLDALKFTPRKGACETPVEVICGARGVLMDDCYFALSPGRIAGMEEAGMTLTDPPCLAFVIRAHLAGSGAIRIIRTLLLVPVPA